MEIREKNREERGCPFVSKKESNSNDNPALLPSNAPAFLFGA